MTVGCRERESETGGKRRRMQAAGESWGGDLRRYEAERRGELQPAAAPPVPLARRNTSAMAANDDDVGLKIEFNVGKGRRLAPSNPEANERMFGVIGMGTQPIFSNASHGPSSAGGGNDQAPKPVRETESHHPDVWIGNTLINPNKGRKPTGEQLATGQKSFVIEQSGAVREDAWLGNVKVNPAKGRGHVPDPAMKKGRSSLFDHMHQKPMNPNVGEERDNWIGHPLHKTGKGRKPLRSGSKKAGDDFSAVMSHSDLREAPIASKQPERDLPKAAKSVVKQVINGTSPLVQQTKPRAGCGQPHPELAKAVMKMDPDVHQTSDRKVKKNFPERGVSKNPLIWAEGAKPHLDISLM